MPGITGVVGTEPAIRLEELKRALFPAPLQARHQASGAALACLVLGASESSGIIERDGVWLAFEGLLFDGARHGRELLGELLDRFVERGESFAAGLNGSFQMAVHARGATYLYADPVASRPLFYRSERQALLFSPEVAPLAEAASAEVDGASLVQFLANGRFFAGQTLLAPVKQLLPGEYLVWSGGRLERRWYFQRRLVAAEPFDRREALERLEAVLERAIIRRWEQAAQPAILLTGGYDSRYIFHTLAEHVADTRTLRTVTWGERPDLPGSDIQIAGEIARRFGTRHQVLERRVDRVPAFFPEMFRAQSGMTEQAFAHADELAICRDLAQTHGIRSWFRGDECFGLTGGGAATRELALEQVSLRRAVRLEESDRWLEGGGEGWLQAQAEHIDRLAASCPEEPNDLRDTLYCDERLPAFLHHLSAYKLHFQEMLNPLLDLEVLQLWATFPVSCRIDKALFKECYHRRFARHLDIPFADKSNGVDWKVGLRRCPEVADFLREGLETLPPPLSRTFFLEKLAEALDPSVPAPEPGRARVSPEQLAMRAFVLGHWLRR